MLLLLPDFTEWATDIIDRLGYPGVGALVALENLIPPIPSEVILPLAGFQADQGDFNLFLLIVVATIGSIVGAMILYTVGAVLGEDRIRRLVGRFGKYILVTVDDIDKATNWFKRHGRTAVFFGRVVPIVRSLVSIPAGVEKMPLGTFLIYTAAGSAIWNTILIVAGYLLGTQYDRVEGFVKVFQYVVILAVLAAVAYFVYRRLTGRREVTGTPA